MVEPPLVLPANRSGPLYVLHLRSQWRSFNRTSTLEDLNITHEVARQVIEIHVSLANRDDTRQATKWRKPWSFLEIGSQALFARVAERRVRSLNGFC